jgi:hypothetical protein
MSRAPFIAIDGRLYRWKDILELRRAQLAAAGAAEASQLALFATLHDDRRPTAERTASGRYRPCSEIRSLKQKRATHDVARLRALAIWCPAFLARPTCL